MSTFVSHIVADLSQKAFPADAPSPPSGAQAQVHISSTQSKEVIRALFVQLDQEQNPQSLRECISELQRLEYGQQLLSAALADGEEQALRRAILSKLALALYAQALSTLLDEAGQAEAELQWWGDVERSRRQVAYYLLQSACSTLVLS